MAPDFPVLPVITTTPDVAAPAPAAGGMSDTEMRQQSRLWWTMHNRACRRELRRRGFTADDARHLDECRCSWPFVRYDQAAAAVASSS